MTRALDALGIPYRVFRHAGPVTSLAQAARERGQAPEQVVRSLVFRVAGRGASPAEDSAGDEYVMVLVAGERQVAWPTLRRFLGVSRLTLASEAELQAVTGYAVGAVAPFGLPTPLRVLVDESALAPAEVSLGSGVRGVAVIMRGEDLRRALGAVEVGRFT